MGLGLTVTYAHSVGFVYFVIRIVWSRPFLMSLMDFYSYMLPRFYRNLCHLSLSDKYPPCWSFRLCFHYSILLRHAIKIMTILYDEVFRHIFGTRIMLRCSLLKVIYDVLWRLHDILWCLHFIVETLLVMISVTIWSFLNKNSFLMSKNYFYFAVFIGISSFLKICSNVFRFSADTFFCSRFHCLESHQWNF